MLTIQRASAGSGKTYTLAKRYIQNLIAYKSETGEWKLRSQRQIEDAIQHILAITFTNKATNEMKQRIVANLAQLSQAANPEVNEDELNKIPYLADFRKTLNVDTNKIGKAAACALKTILNNYSLFKISTIDSFFQEILRTFTYEANINDSYQLEIDTNYVTDSALDATMHELDTHPENMGNAVLWFKILMKEEAKKTHGWNPFNKRASARSIYSKIRNALSQLEKEDFKAIKENLDSYFSEPENKAALIQFYNLLREKAMKERENQLMLVKLKLNKIEDLILSYGYSDKELQSNFLKQLKKIAALDMKSDKIPFSINKWLNDRTVFKKKFITPDNPLDIEAISLYEILDNWIPRDSYYKAWQIYSPQIPYLGLILEARTFLSKVLENNNLIQLSDTSYILQKIIGNDDAPFVYERLGNRIDHYLIDEFQDTSRMQWQIIYPLLNEGVGKNKESLIIGDPKQSIYRFRNADHRLITQVVPNTFKQHIAAGFSTEENTNWRSHTEIVDFNNKFFSQLAKNISLLSFLNGGATDFSELYANVEQEPHNKDGKGYVEIRIFQKNEEEERGEKLESDDDDTLNWFEQKALEQLPQLISSLIERGYRQKDICVLVNTNERGKSVVKTLMAYNETLPSDKQIEFMSEESLLVSSSPAVDAIINILSKITDPDTKNVSSEKEISPSRKYYNWNKIKSDFNVFSRTHSHLSPSDQIMMFLRECDSSENFASLLEDLPNPTLSGLVETIIKTFLDDDIRSKEALYLASFQDLVTEFSAGYPSDAALFLEWWNSRGIKMSVASPEGTDAVQIMTIHKSKGLEFKCVIVPFATDSFSARKEEWRWVVPMELNGLETPPVLPVATSSILKNSIHEFDYNEFYDQVLTDTLNMSYVAFTRSRNELYIFTKEVTSEGSTLAHFIMKIFSEELKQNPQLICFGQPFSSAEISYERAKENKNENVKTITRFFEDYFVNKKQPKLLSKAAKVLPSGETL